VRIDRLPVDQEEIVRQMQLAKVMTGQY
jgi:hypothetical protein